MRKFAFLAGVLLLAGCRPEIRPTVTAAVPTPVAVPTAQPTPLPTYTVKAGDTLWAISPALLGDAFYWPLLYRQNRDQLLYGADWIDVGQALVVGPHTAVDDSQARQEAYDRPMFYSHGKKSE